MSPQLLAQAATLRELLVRRKQRLILTESCTGGWLAASLATLPGISQWWCGSLVVYRSGSKQQWLEIAAATLDDPAIGPVSELVTTQLAQQALVHTDEADVSIAVTGDLGPGVTQENDGRVFCALSVRGHTAVLNAQTRLLSPAPRDSRDVDARVLRLEEASQWVLARSIDWLTP